jgi:hypothetical protein
VNQAEARRMVLMDMLDHAARRSESWHEAAARNREAQPMATEWDRTRETLLASIAKHDTAHDR